jgi:hypothetical protein
LGVIFLYAGFIKIVDPLGFAQALYNYHILPGWMINPVAIILPWVELVTAGSLLFGIWQLGGGVVATALLGVFALALGINLARGVSISCGCFSTASTAAPITWFHLARDLILLGMGLFIVLFDQGVASLESLFRKNPAPRAQAR